MPDFSLRIIGIETLADKTTATFPEFVKHATIEFRFDQIGAGGFAGGVGHIPITDPEITVDSPPQYRVPVAVQQVRSVPGVRRRREFAHLPPLRTAKKIFRLAPI